jgi:hypothetical protein
MLAINSFYAGLRKSLTELWSEGGEYGFPYNYIGIATPGFPNLLFILGPKRVTCTSTLCGTVPERPAPLGPRMNKRLGKPGVAIPRKVGREGIKTIQPSKKAADDFVQYSDAFWKTTV